MTLADPLRFEPFPFPKIWGGEQLEPYLGATFDARPLGEVWQLVDRDGCSSVVADGPYAGRRLSGLMLSERADLLGKAEPSAEEHFPLLIKLLDAAMPLSIQVHPDFRAADRLKGESKDECWYVLDAVEDAEIYLGLREGVDATTFAAEVGGSKIVDLLQSYPVRKGQFVSVPAGTVHAIGGGVTLVEVQENADTTYRIYDWERRGLDGRPRPLQVEEALQSIDFDSSVRGPIDPEFVAVDEANEAAELWTTRGFSVELLRVNKGWARDTNGAPLVYIVVSGSGLLRNVDGDSEPVKVARGQTWLLPSAVGPHRFEECSGDLEVLAVRTCPSRIEG